MDKIMHKKYLLLTVTTRSFIPSASELLYILSILMKQHSQIALGTATEKQKHLNIRNLV